MYLGINVSFMGNNKQELPKMYSTNEGTLFNYTIKFILVKRILQRLKLQENKTSL